jgi:hypothetical protein
VAFSIKSELRRAGVSRTSAAARLALANRDSRWLESWDRASFVCHPEHPSWQILNDAYRELASIRLWLRVYESTP